MASRLHGKLLLWGFAPVLAWALSWSDAVRAQTTGALPAYVIKEFGQPPSIPTGPLSEGVTAAMQSAFVDSLAQSSWVAAQSDALATIVGSRDPRLAWLINDMMRFVSSSRLNATFADAAADLLEITPPTQNEWEVITNHLIAWDIPAPPDYLRFKRAIFATAVPGWDRIFVEGDIDWRQVSWGGVLIDDRAYNRTDKPCN